MRILRIAIESLASLRDAQPVIDLTASPFSDAGIIAITGPTGAGKSTILDAVCLSLFGRTPRLDSRGEDVRDLLSRGAGEGSVKVDLQLDSGVHWRASWSVRRARGKSDGALQISTVEIHDAITGALLAAGRRDVDALIASDIGLSFDQFRGVVLLSQGDFARFLQADEGARAELLEKMTGTQLYTQLSIRAFEKQKELEGVLREQHARLEGKPVLADEMRAALDADIAEIELANAEGEAQIKRETSVCAYWKTLGNLEKERHNAQLGVESVANDLLAAESERARLARAERAERARDALGRMQRARKGMAEAVVAHDAAVAERDEHQVKVEALRKALTEELTRADDLVLQASATLASLARDSTIGDGILAALDDAWNAAMAADKRSLEHTRARTEATAQLVERKASLDGAAKALEASTADKDALEKACASLREQRVAALDNATLEQIVGQKRALQEAIGILRVAATVDHAALVRNAEQLQASAASKLSMFESWQSTTQSAEASVQACERTQRAELQLSQIRNFTHLVEDGKPCPLCGALEHPTVADARDSALQQSERELENATRELANARAKSTEARASLDLARSEASKANSALEAEDSARTARAARWSALRSEAPSLEGTLDATSVASLEAAVQTAGKRLDTFNALDAALNKQEGLLKAAAAQHTRIVSAHETALARFDDQTQLCEKLHAALQSSQQDAQHANAAAVALVTHTASLLHELTPEPADMRSWSEALAARRAAYEIANKLHELALESQQSGDEAREALSAAPASSFTPPATGELSAAAIRDARNALHEAFTALKLGLQGVGHKDREAGDRRSAKNRTSQEKEDAELQLRASLAEQKFTDEADALFAALPPAQLDALRESLAKLTQRQSAAFALLERAAQQLEQHLGHAAELGLETTQDTSSALAAAEAQLAGTQETKSRRDQLHGEKLSERRQDDEARAVRASMSGELEALRTRLEEAERLCQLIGQKDGGKFRKFAQALTLDQLVALANRRLISIAPRYALAREPVNENRDVSLKLEVIDHELADERRPVATLSGGETFLVSLALALGLADLRRGRVKLGTLFIDEGFGTLDAFTLEHALATLERLQVEQRTQILLISHVGALHERIAHRIEVNRRGRGKSRLRLVGPDGVVAEAPPHSPLAEETQETPMIRSKRKKR